MSEDNLNPYIIFPYPFKKYIQYFIGIIFVSIIITIALKFQYQNQEFGNWLYKSLSVLLIVFLHLRIFSAEKVEDERVQLVRFKSLMTTGHFLFVMIISNMFVNLSEIGDANTFGYATLGFYILIFQLIYLYNFNNNLKKDPDWIHEDIAKKFKTPLSNKSIILKLLVLVLVFYSSLFTINLIFNKG
ncbi:hypothetical protein OAQ99_05355 [Candidatus Kapabacteria bacterium]|nr:hypothetical protein [Candidatus Kapabacteria bacterium]